jgi:hypothetical protein
MQDRKLVIQYLTYIDADPAFYTSKLAAFDMQIMDCFTGVDTERIEEETGYSSLLISSMSKRRQQSITVALK